MSRWLRLMGTGLGLLALLAFSALPDFAGASHQVAKAQSEKLDGLPDFSTWHLPLPAGEWQISRGPCGAATLFKHECGYYENKCALDLAPIAGSMENVPVLAPQAGQVFFMGTRPESGQTLMLLHPDGRVSVFFHLAKIVIGLDEAVAQGQVVAYAGSTGNVRPHLHFFVQRNAVERECLDTATLDVINFRTGRATSRNRPWAELELVYPPENLPDWLPTLILSQTNTIIMPKQLRLAPKAQVHVPVAVAGQVAATDSLAYRHMQLSPTRRSLNYAVFDVWVAAFPQPGTYGWEVQVTSSNRRIDQLKSLIPITVQIPPATRASQGLLLASLEMTSPTSWMFFDAAPSLCWRVPASAGQAPLSFRVMAVGPTPVDSGWITTACWPAPKLEQGTYFWKVFVRDSNGYMSRTQQRPFAFVIR